MQENEKLTTSLNIRMTQELRNTLEELARQDNRKPGDYVRLVLIEHIGRDNARAQETVQ
jgi:predicted DNA-binding protein